VIAIGAVLASVGAWWPVTTRERHESKLIDAFVPRFQFSEFHTTSVKATPAQVYAAVRAVTADEIRFFRLLTWIRAPRLPGRRPESILAPSPTQPLLDVALRSGFVLLGETTVKELVIGTVVCCAPARLRTAEDFVALDRAGYARAAMDFRIEDLGNGLTSLTTETRVCAVGADVRRRFGVYWSLIYPGSSIIRSSWLAAIRRRAETH